MVKLVYQTYNTERKMESHNYTLSVLTLGCRVNQYESDSITSKLKANGVTIVPFGEKCDASLINTCTVTAESDRKSRQMIRRAAQYTDKVIVAGCFSQISPEDAANIDGVVYVCGNSNKSNLADVILQILDGYIPEINNNVVPFNDSNRCDMILSEPMRTRSYIKIEDGCANKCSYCIISSARGPVCSKPMDDVIGEIKQIAAKGCREIILTGIETASYGMDLPGRKPYGYALADLIEKVNEIDGIERIGLGSLDPSVMSEYFVESIARSHKVLPHFHLSIQSGSSRILAKMRRKYNRESALSAIGRMKERLPHATYSADIIVGFPGETTEDFMETVSFCREVSFLHLHIFPYSKRSGTEAANMPDQVHGEISRERLNLLENTARDIKNVILNEYVAIHTKSPVYVLVEKNNHGTASGHSEHFIEVFFPSETATVGEIIPVILQNTNGNVCFGAEVPKNRTLV